jgi:hypothetical protein
MARVRLKAIEVYGFFMNNLLVGDTSDVTVSEDNRLIAEREAKQHGGPIKAVSQHIAVLVSDQDWAVANEGALQPGRDGAVGDGLEAVALLG